MCHDAFELSFGPRVNFVIGPNGSGKSALLTALVVALGGRATITQRAKKNSDFVMYGKKYAKVCVTIHNYDKVMEKDRAFKPDDYGKSIIIEKIIYKDDISKLNIKNDKDKKVSERKQELDEMLEHFGILINNPICILNQEVSKTFLHSKRPEDKFDLFMKATNLEQIEQDYNNAKESFKKWEDCNNRSTVTFKLLDAEYNSCKEKTEFLADRAKLNDKREALLLELFWAILRDEEVKCEKLKEDIQSTKNCISEADEEIKGREVKMKRFEEDLESLETKSISVQSEVQKTRDKIQASNNVGVNLRMQQVSIKQHIEQCERRISRLNRDKSDAEKAIEDKRRQLREQNALDQDSEKRKQDKERLESEIKTLQARASTLSLHTSQLNASLGQMRIEHHSSNAKIKDLKTRLGNFKGLLSRLQNGQKDNLRKYGDYAVKVREEIDKLHTQGRFKQKPIGPLGYYLKIENPEIANPLEIHLGRNAHAFLCDNHQDMSVLSGIFKKLATNSRDFRHPMIIMRSFTKRHDISRYSAHHNRYKTLLDYITIESDAVFNALVDRTGIECVLYVPDYTEAQNLLITHEMTPPNTRCAYTKDSSVMYPITSAGGYRSYANNTQQCSLFSESNARIIKDTERDIEQIKAELRDAEAADQRIKDSLDVQRKEYNDSNKEQNDIRNKLRELEGQLQNLKMTVVHEPQDLYGLEEERENILKSLGSETIKLEQFKNELASVNEQLRDHQREKSDLTEILNMRDKERQAISKSISDTKESMNVVKEHIRNKQKFIENRSRDLLELIKKSDEALEVLAKRQQEVQNAGSKPNRVRGTAELEEEKRKIDAKLRAQQEEMMDPEEMMNNLQKRMKEIENMTYLKDLNLSNAKSTSKTLNDRTIGFDNLCKNTISAVAGTFSTVMRSMKMNGVLEIHINDLVHRGEVMRKAKTLDIRIDTNYTPSQRVGSVMGDNNNNTPNNRASRVSHSQPAGATSAPRPKRARVGENTVLEVPINEKENDVKMTDARSLSGGERSFSTVAFVLALWQHCASPFKLMDEIDVFMDMVTRRISYNALIRFAQCTENPGQFIFFSPLELPKFDDSGALVRVFEMPAIMRKGTQNGCSQPSSTLGESGDNI